MKKLGIIFVALLLTSGFAFSQAQPAGFSNTVYMDFGTANLDGPGMTYNKDDVDFNGFIDHFTANISTNKVDISGDITWKFLNEFELEAKLIGHNFNGTMTPFTGFNIGFGTNLDWQVGPKPFSGPAYTAYTMPYYAGFAREEDGYVKNYFAQKSIALRYTYEKAFSVGFGLNSENSKAVGIWARIPDLATLGFAYNGDFNETDNNYYFGSELFLDALNIDLWLNIAQKYNTTFGSRFEFYTKTKSFYFAPEFSATMWEQENKGMSMYIALLSEMSLSNEVLAGLNASWGLGSDPNTSNDSFDGGSRFNINPHLVWNLNKSHRLAIGANLMNIIDGYDTSKFYWNIPISWTVKF